MTVSPFTIGVGLSGIGAHPGARHDQAARPDRLVRGSWWRDLVQSADRAGVDAVFFEDRLGSDGTDLPRPDALMVASFVGPLTAQCALVPVVTTTHTEPFHVATALQTFDHATGGRAGWHVRVSEEPRDAQQFNRRELPADVEERRNELWREAAEVIQVARGVWDSWEDDAVILDAAHRRFIDRDRIHQIDFVGAYVQVEGPSFVPRSPQGQCPVVVSDENDQALAVAAAHADVVLVRPGDDAAGAIRRARDAEARAARSAPLLVHIEATVLLDETPGLARTSLERLDARAGVDWRPDVVGTSADLVALVDTWRAAGADGVLLRPARLPRDLQLLTTEVIPALRAIAWPESYRHRLGLPRPLSRYDRSHA